MSALLRERWCGAQIKASAAYPPSSPTELADLRSMLLDSDYLGEHPVPINGDPGNGSERYLSFELKQDRTPVVSCFQPVESQNALDGVYEPNLADTGALVNWKFDAPVMVGGTR